MVTYADLKAANDEFRNVHLTTDWRANQTQAQRREQLYRKFKELKAEFERPFIEAAARGAVIYFRRRDSKTWRVKGTQKNQWDGLVYEYVIEFDNIVNRLREGNSLLYKEAAKYIEYLEGELSRLRMDLSTTSISIITDYLK